MTTTTFIDVPAEACQKTLAATSRVHAWLRAELTRKLKPVQRGKSSNRIFVEHVGVVIPREPRKTCTVVMPDGTLCGRKAQAKELCGTHYMRKREGRPMHPVQKRLTPKHRGKNLSGVPGSLSIKMKLESKCAADPRVTPDFLRSSGGGLFPAVPDAQEASR